MAGPAGLALESLELVAEAAILRLGASQAVLRRAPRGLGARQVRLEAPHLGRLLN